MTVFAHPDPEAYLVGHDDGKREASALAVTRLLAAEDIMRAQADELDSLRSQLERSERLRRKLRAQLATPIVLAARWSALTCVLTFIATWNVAS